MTARRALRALIAAALVLPACSATPGPPPAGPGGDAVVVASFNFDESRLLGEIYAQALEHAGIPVRRELDLGPRELVRPALRQGLVDVVPEYLGTAVATARGTGTDGRLGRVELLAELRAALRPWGLLALTPSAAADQNAVAVLAPWARERGVRTLTDLARREPPITLAGPAECPHRPLCLPGLRRAYGLRVRAFVAADDPGQRLATLTDGDAGAEITFTTDPRAATGEIVLLADDRHLQPDEAVTPVVSVRAVRRWGARLVRALDAVSAALTTRALTFLNWRVTVAGDGVGAEADGWLRRHGLGGS